MMIKNDIDWCNAECEKNNLRLFGYTKLEAICERISIMVDSGTSEIEARKLAFKIYTGNH